MYSSHQIILFALWTWWNRFTFLVLRTPDLDTAPLVVSHKDRREEENHLPQPTGLASSGSVQDGLGPLAKCWIRSGFSCMKTCNSFSTELLSKGSCPRFCTCLGLPQQDLAFGLVGLHEGFMDSQPVCGCSKTYCCLRQLNRRGSGIFLSISTQLQCPQRHILTTYNLRNRNIFLFGFVWQGLGNQSWWRVNRWGFSEKLPGAFPVSDRSNVNWLQEILGDRKKN